MNDTTASLLVRSDQRLDPSQCVEVERLSAPQYDVAGAPEAYEFARAYACGVWTVIPTDTGWYGWTPNSPREQEAAAAARD